LGAAVAIGIIGKAIFPAELLTYSDSENIFVVLSSNLLPALLAGFVMAGILAATISSSDSYLLIAASAFSKNIYQHLIKKDATDRQVMNISRIILVVISIIGIFIALDENSVIFTIVSFAWAGFGATFGPITIFSLFWKRTTNEGAIAGMLSGAIMVFVWKLILKPMGGFFGVYELLPAFIVSCIFIFAVSKITSPPSEEILQEFEMVRKQTRE
jgi:sodium/proline symporter